MPIAPHDNSAVEPQSDFSVAEIFAIRGLNSDENPLSLNVDEMTTFENFLLHARHIKRRLGSATYGADPGSITKVIGLGHLEKDSGTTLLFLGDNGDLYKYSSGWSVSDKTNYDVTNDASILTFTTKSGSSLDNGTTTSGTTKYIVEDTGQSWTPGEHRGRCVVIEGEVKYILDNTATTLFLSDRLNSETDADYQSVTYNIHAVAPHAFIANGVDNVQKYNLTSHTAINGSHVTSGEALPLYRHMAIHQGRLWGSPGAGDDNDKVFISDVAIGEQNTKDTNLNINLSFMNEGDEVTGLASLPISGGSVLLVTKNDSVHSVEGTNVLDYAVHPRGAKEGCIAPKTLKVSGRSAFMLGYNGVHRFSGEGVTDLLSKPIPISDPINDAITGASLANRQAACAEVWDNKYFLCIGSTMYVYDIVESLRRQTHIWSTLSFPWSFNFLHSAGNTLYAGSSTTGQVYQLFTGNNDDGSRIEATMTTANVTFPGAPTGYVDRIEVQADTDANVVLRVAYAKDGGPFGGYITATLDQTIGIYKFSIKERATAFKFKFIDNATGDPVRIAMPIRLFYSIDNFGQRETKLEFAS